MAGRIFLGRYETVRLLGEGGMGRVYLARQLDLGRQVVIKVMHDHIANDPKFRERFQRETLLMAQFQHPYAVTLYDASLNDPSGPCIIMEYIRGITLDTLLHRNGRLTPTRAGRLLGQLCEALQAAHSQGIIHRDLKPANLMVVEADTPFEKIKVMDFGLAKLVQSPSFQKGSDTGAEFAVGTPGYISPEQVRGEEMDHRGDLYSVGVILYELLTGRMPFSGRSTMDILLAHATESPPPFSEVGAADWVPPAIEAVVQSCLAKLPADRPASARELAERFETALAHEEVVHAQDVPDQPTSRPDVPVYQPTDPNAVVHHLEAWMPERIAAYKLRGFVDDVGGELVENVPGRIHVRLGGRGSLYRAPGQKGPLSWLGLGRKSGLIDMELHLVRADPTRESLVHITVTMRSQNGETALNPEWRARCNQIFCDLRGYLMGQTGVVTELGR
jgi:serine/threonine-protein kinase